MGKVKSNLISSRENFNFIVCKTLFSCHSENFQNSLKISSYDPYTMMRTVLRGQVILESLETLDVKRFISEKGCPSKNIIKHDYS